MFKAKIKPKTGVVLFKNPFKDGIGESPLDEEKEEFEILRRYDTALRTLVLRGYYKLYEVG